MEENQPDSKPQEPDKRKVVGILLMEAGFEFAFLIAVPLIVGIWGGKWLDAKYNHRFFVVIGILLGIAVSCIAIYSRIKDYKALMNKNDKN